MIAYDFHVHTCLSPCADNDMTPMNVIDRAVENGLDILAVADHNSLANMQVTYEYAMEQENLVFLPAIEVESAEEVHVLCLFPDYVSANRMARVVSENMVMKYNKPKTFGHQYIIDDFGDVIEEEIKLLKFPTKMTIEDIFYVARQMRGVALYAQVDNKGSSVFSILGTLPERPNPKGMVVSNSSEGRAFAEKVCSKYDKPVFFSSSAHSLDEINTRENSHDLESFGGDMRTETGKLTAQSVIDWLRSYDGI